MIFLHCIHPVLVTATAVLSTGSVIHGIYSGVKSFRESDVLGWHNKKKKRLRRGGRRTFRRGLSESRLERLSKEIDDLKEMQSRTSVDEALEFLDTAV